MLTEQIPNVNFEEVRMKPKKPGRRMKVGRWCYDEKKKCFGIFGNYCPECFTKQIYDRDELTMLFKFVRKDEKRWSTRLLRHLLDIRRI